MSKVPSSVFYTRPEQSTPAVPTEVSFIPDSTATFAYNQTQFINIPIRTSIENAFLDARHSFLRMTVHNTSPFPIYFDGLSSSIIRKFTITAGGIVLSNIDQYNRLVDLLMEHWGSDDYTREMAILAGQPQKAGAYFELLPKSGVATNLSANPTAGLTIAEINSCLYGSATSNLIIGNNVIPANGATTIAIPIISSFLLSKLIPLCFMSNAFLTLNLQLEDPRVAFNVDGSINTVANVGGIVGNANLMTQGYCNSNIGYYVDNIEYVATVLSFRDNALVQKLGSMLLSEGLYIHGTDYTAYTQNVLGSNAAQTLTLSIPDRSQSMKYILNAFYNSLPDAKFSSIQSGVFGTTSYQVQLGGVNYPQSRPIYYNSGGGTVRGNFIQPYLSLQKVSSNGYFSTNNHTCVEFQTYAKQSPNSLMYFGNYANNQVATSGIVYSSQVNGANAIVAVANQYPAVAVNGIIPANANTVYQGSFVQALSFESFANANGVECGINTQLLNVPLNLIITRDPATYIDATSYNTNGVNGLDASGIPQLTMITFVASDIIWKMNAQGLFELLK